MRVKSLAELILYNDRFVWLLSLGRFLVTAPNRHYTHPATFKPLGAGRLFSEN